MPSVSCVCQAGLGCRGARQLGASLLQQAPPCRPVPHTPTHRAGCSVKTEACLHYRGPQIAAACIWLALKLLKEDTHILNGGWVGG